MARPAADLREQAQERWPGATIVERGRNFIRHQHPSEPGRFILDTTLGPLHIAGTETEIDTAWQPTTGAWQYEMTTADYQAFSRNVLNAGDTIQYRDPGSGQTVTFQPLALNWTNQDNSRQQITQPQAVTATVQDDTLLWLNGYGTGRHFQWQTQTGRLQKLLTIDSAANLPAPTVTGTIHLELEFIIKLSSDIDLYLDSLRWARTNGVRVRTGNRIEFRSITSGAALWYLDYPRAWDSAGNETIGQFEVRRQSNTFFITVRIPHSWVQAATFPIYIDPTIDPQVGSGGNDGAWDGTSFVTTPTNPGLGRASNGTTRETAQLFTSISGLSGATIDVSYLSLWTTAILAGAGGTMRVAAQDAASPSAPTNTTTWNTALANRTTAYSSDWLVPNAGGAFTNSPSLNTVIQELADSYDPTAILILVTAEPCTNNNATRCLHYDSSSSVAPKIHIEYTAGGGAVNLVIADASIAHSADNLAITQVHSLAVNDALLANTAENLAITQEHVLAVNDAALSHSADSFAITQEHALAIDDAALSHGADSIVFTQVHNLLIDDATLGHTAESSDVNEAGNLVIADAVMSFLADSFAITQVHNLQIDDAFIGHYVDNLAGSERRRWRGLLFPI